MKHLLLAGAVCALVPAGALAADQGGSTPPDSTWDRTYIGAQLGIAGLNSDWTIDDFVFDLDDVSLTDTCLVLGVFAGHDVQMDGFVLGAEADFNFLDCNDSETFISDGEGLTVSASVDAIGSLRGRVGIPVDNLLFYATAGIAVGTATVSYATSDYVVPAGSDAHDLKLGLVAGAGVEAMVTDTVGVRLQGLYYNFGSHTFDAEFGSYKADLSAFALTAGVTWKF
ncbi:outer membrane protein [Devosia sp.]|jgi:outer membrane immunogenic protein|uniref:outer membrane protein n=1 Tax=Devosia sp. TaxID=1871048 RepID=UPI003F6EE793